MGYPKLFQNTAKSHNLGERNSQSLGFAFPVLQAQSHMTNIVRREPAGLLSGPPE